MQILLLILSLGGMSSRSDAWTQENLPKGIGTYQLGLRSFMAQTDNFDQNGHLVPLGDKFRKDFTGPGLLQGDGGPDLQRLAKEIQKFDSNSTSQQGLLNNMDLGHIEGDVHGSVRATFLGFGYGLTDTITLFLGAPWIDAAVDADVSYAGPNNAQEIKSRLGNAAFDELKSGLDRAAAISSDQIKSSFAEKGYAPIEHWENHGIGDVRFGGTAGFTPRINSNTTMNFSATTTATAPTGYVDDPDVLTDVSLGKGYYTLGEKLNHKTFFYNHFSLGADATYTYNFAGIMRKRVPLGDESLVDQERTTDVNLNPGDDVDVGASTGTKFGMVQTNYRLARKYHYGDRYSGPLEGNYDKLEEFSDSYQTYHELTATISTVKAVRNKKFIAPFIVNVTAHLPIQGHNTPNDRYYEISFLSFFATPAAHRSEQRADRKPKKERSKRAIAH